MSALTANTNRDNRVTEQEAIPVAASAHIYKGGLVAVVVASGYATPGADTAGLRIVGVAENEANNSSGASGDVSVPVRRNRVEKFACASATQAWVGNLVYAVDDNTVALAATTTNDIVVGTVVKFESATAVWVDMSLRA